MIKCLTFGSTTVLLEIEVRLIRMIFLLLLSLVGE